MPEEQIQGSSRIDVIRANIIRDMSEGVIIVGLDGIIRYVNAAAEDILEKPTDDLVGKTFALAFFEYSENDRFNQAVLDAVYDKSSTHHNLVPYFTGTSMRRLHMLTSFLMDGDERLGLIVVISDITELAELRIRYAEQITVLLDSLVRALSTAIDERSPYNANHTRNMVLMAEEFLDWLARSGEDWEFDEDRRRAFVMSVWLHDVGKPAVPLEVMDKATRLGPALERVEERFARIQLLEKIAFLERRIERDEWDSLREKRQAQLEFIRRVNGAGFLPDEDLQQVLELAEERYEDELGERRPLLLPDEIDDLSIRRGTLTDAERTVMQSHAVVTGRILDQVQFPEAYAKVPEWASSHHELLDGAGYPVHLNAETIPREVRLLTILDIFEALTARDRPYKAPMPLEKAWAILHDMADEGSLDSSVLALFEKSRAWETILEDK